MSDTTTLEKRGIRNNNPLNIRDTTIDWQGLAAVEEMTPVQRGEKEFEVFRAPEWGIRAAVLNLQTYGRRKLDTIAEIIESWAPRKDPRNKTDAYIEAVAKAVGVDKDEIIDTADPEVLLKLIKAMIYQENGKQPYADDLIMSGILLALHRNTIQPETKVAAKVRGQVRHALTFSSGLAAALALGIVTQQDADTLTSAYNTLFTDENMQAVAAAYSVIAGLVGVVLSWFSPDKKKGNGDS